MPRFFRVRNFEEFQVHDKRESRKGDPWVKLHCNVLVDDAFLALDDASRAHLMLIWTIAKKRNNILPYNASLIKSLIQARSPVDLKTMLKLRVIELCDKKGLKSARRKSASDALAIGERRASNSQASRAPEDEMRVDEMRVDESAGELADLFVDAKLGYPRRADNNGGHAARAEWDRLVSEGVSPRAMLDGVLRYAAYCRVSGVEPKFVTRFDNFLKRREFEAEWKASEEMPPPLLPDGISPNPVWLAQVPRSA